MTAVSLHIGLPFAPWLSKIDEKRHIPVNATILSSGVSCLLALIYIGSTTPCAMKSHIQAHMLTSATRSASLLRHHLARRRSVAAMLLPLHRMRKLQTPSSTTIQFKLTHTHHRSSGAE